MGPYGAHHCKRWGEKREGVQVWGIGGGFGEGFGWEIGVGCDNGGWGY